MSCAQWDILILPETYIIIRHNRKVMSLFVLSRWPANARPYLYLVQAKLGITAMR